MAFAMAYAISKGFKKWADVPVAWRPAVKTWLDVFEINEDGTPFDPTPQP